MPALDQRLEQPMDRAPLAPEIDDIVDMDDPLLNSKLKSRISISSIIKFNRLEYFIKIWNSFDIR
jgi:hypothetical protein